MSLSNTYDYLLMCLCQADGIDDVPGFFLPGHNKFIPSRLEVDKKEVAEVSQISFRPFLC